MRCHARVMPTGTMSGGASNFFLSELGIQNQMMFSKT